MDPPKDASDAAELRIHMAKNGDTAKPLKMGLTFSFFFKKENGVPLALSIYL